MRRTSLQTVGADQKIRLAPIPDLVRRTREVQDLIAERAHHLYRYGARQAGDDLEEWLSDWVRAESEVLCPVDVQFSQTPQHLNVKLTVPGFTAAELQLSLDAVCLAISGKKHAAVPPNGQRPSAPRPAPVQQIFRVVSLPVSVNPSGMTATFRSSVLRLSIPRHPLKLEAKKVAGPGSYGGPGTKRTSAISYALLLLA